MKKSKLEIINEVVAHFSEDPSRRATNCSGDCVYRTEDGRACAVGMFIQDSCYVPSYEGISADALLHAGNDEMLLEDYRGHGITFWLDLQLLHDCPDYWNSEGLTDLGREYLQEIVEIWTEEA